MRIEPKENFSKRMLHPPRILLRFPIRAVQWLWGEQEGDLMNTKGVLKRVVFLGMLFAGSMGYAQNNHWKEHTQTTGVTDAGGEALLARLVELQNYTLSILQKAQF